MTRTLVSTFVALLLVVAVGTQASEGQSSTDRHEEFQAWIASHLHQATTDWSGTPPTHTELFKRFCDTMDAVQKLNEESAAQTQDSQGRATFAPNHLALLSQSEFQRRFSGNTLIAPKMSGKEKSSDVCHGTPPGVTSWTTTQNHSKTIARTNVTCDWQRAGAVTRVRNQGQCGSCYVFAMVAALEGMYQIKHHRLLAFSEQYALDCGPRASCLLGCGGGSTLALAGVMQSKDHLGLFPLAKNYEYEAYKNETEETCNTAIKGQPGSQLTEAYSLTSSYTTKGATDIGDAELVMQAYLQEHGPIAVAVDASGAEWQHYAGGVLQNPCKKNAPTIKDTELNHGVTIVGYGTTEEGVDYWRVKNSWTPVWGETGYVLIQRGCNAYGIGYFPVGGAV